MSNERDHARPLLSTVNEAIKEIITLVALNTTLISDDANNWIDFEKSVDEILDKYDINYNNEERWSVK